MKSLATPYIFLLIILGSITITTVVADTVTINSYPYAIQDNSANQRFVISSSGNVGIGTINPYTALDVPGSVTPWVDNSYPIRASDSIDSRRELLLGYYASSEIGIIQAAKTGVAWEPISLDPNGGNVGIGTINPSQKLDVNGNIRLVGNIVSPNDICIGSC